MEKKFSIPATSSDEMGMENEVYVSCGENTMYKETCDLLKEHEKSCDCKVCEEEELDRRNSWAYDEARDNELVNR